jgi:myo-inositol-1(or 4)-monophosphatase
MIKTAIEAARRAGKILKDNLGQIKEISHKGEIDLVTEVDRLSERCVVETIKTRYPDHQILGEEGEANHITASAYKWLIDPLDGTTNYIHGLSLFCVSIALEKDDELIAGVVYDPMHDELFVAEKGRGAFLNQEPIQVSQVEKLEKSLLVTGFPPTIWQNYGNNFEHFKNFSLRCQGVRRLGSAAIDLCYVAAGRLEAFWERGLKPWDMGAGAIIVEEAGGRVTDFKGRKFHAYQGEILSSNGKIHSVMQEVLQLAEG